MLGVIVAAVVLFMFKDSPDPDSYVWELMFLVPVTLATAFFVALSLRFRDRLLASVADRNDLKIELNGQFRFARAVAVSCALVGFYMIWNTWNSGVDHSQGAAMLAYMMVVGHLLTFLLYSLLYNRLHFSRRRSVLQVSIIMSVVMLVVVHSSGQIREADGDFWSSCSVVYELEVEEQDGEISRRTVGGDETDEGIQLDKSLVSSCVPARLEQLRARDDAIRSIVSASVVRDMDGSALMFGAYTIIWLVYAGFWVTFLNDLVQASRRARRASNSAQLTRGSTVP
ncbi:MAG: hypothetical protein IPK28_21800 [Devosia sp.]|nr:hypothetical protein [Devosia sp.]